MLTNQDRAFLDNNWSFLNKIARLEKKGVDVGAMVDIAGEIIKLHDRSQQANFDLLALTTFIVEQRSAESADNERSSKAA